VLSNRADARHDAAWATRPGLGPSKNGFRLTAACREFPLIYEVDTGSLAAHRHRMNRRFAYPLIAGLIATLPGFAWAETYKWIDETGAVTYGDAPPPQAKSLRVLGKDSGSLSVVPGVAPERLERMRETASELRLRRLEVEMEELRLREQALAQAQRELSYSEPAQTVYWGGGYGAGYPIAPGWRDKRFWPRPPARSRPDLDLLPFERARLISAPPVAGSRR